MEKVDGIRRRVFSYPLGNLEECLLKLMQSTSAPPGDCETLSAILEWEVNKARRAAERRTQQLVALEQVLQRQLEENAGLEHTLKRLDSKIEESLKWKKRLFCLDLAAKKRKAQLMEEVKIAEIKLNELVSSVNKEAELLPTCSPALTCSFENTCHVLVQSSDRRRSEESCLRRLLQSTKCRYREVCDFNKRISALLADINAEEKDKTSRHDVNLLGKNSCNVEAFKAALQDLVDTFEAVRRAAFLTE